MAYGVSDGAGAFRVAERVAARFRFAARRVGMRTSQPFAELDCLRDVLDAAVLARAGEKAAAAGTGGDRVLIGAGDLDEQAYLQILGDSLGVGVVQLDGMARALCPLADARLVQAARLGMLPCIDGGEAVMVVAPRGLAARNIALAVREDPALAASLRFTTSAQLDRFVLRHAGTALAAEACNALRRRRPSLSAGPPRRWTLLIPLTLTLAALSAAVWFDVVTPAAIALTSAAIRAALFVAWLGLRLCAAALAARPAPGVDRLPGDTLPVYSVICALYREAASAGDLLAAIERLDYPREKLNVIIALEAEDSETRAAIEQRKNRVPVTLVDVPPVHPRTKPKALNAALHFAHGAFTVIYDAEDRPEPDQLRRALQAFKDGGDKLACVQARLTIDNTVDGWLARLFTAEYAGQFDVFLPGLAVMGLPLPLGGSSNHFRTATLRAAGAWDPYNVTEDADLGMRLARLGYRTATIASTTHEEAPARLGAWLRQRTRWFKGWMRPCQSLDFVETSIA